MLPPCERFSVAPVLRLTNSPSGGPPVPASLDLGSRACGQPNWFMKPGITCPQVRARMLEEEGWECVRVRVTRCGGARCACLLVCAWAWAWAW
eukprot:1948201-Pleurochrysis_carterae.AAC.1